MGTEARLRRIRSASIRYSSTRYCSNGQIGVDYSSSSAEENSKTRVFLSNIPINGFSRLELAEKKSEKPLKSDVKDCQTENERVEKNQQRQQQRVNKNHKRRAKTAKNRYKNPACSYPTGDDDNAAILLSRTFLAAFANEYCTRSR